MHCTWSNHGIGASGEGQFVYTQIEFVQSNPWPGKEMKYTREVVMDPEPDFRDCDYLGAYINKKTYKRGAP